MYTEKDLQDLEQFFKTVDLPKKIELSQSEKITDVKKFVDAHLAAVRANMNNNTFSAFFDRLVKLKELLKIKIPA